MHSIALRFEPSLMTGLFLVERLLKRQPKLRDGFVPVIKPLVRDQNEAIRGNARRVWDGFSKGL
jgi:hypothetical protein